MTTLEPTLTAREHKLALCDCIKALERHLRHESWELARIEAEAAAHHARVLSLSIYEQTPRNRTPRS